MWPQHVGISGQSVYFLADLMKQHEVCWSLVSCICMPSAVLLLDMFHWMPIYDMVALIARVFRCVECGQRHKISALSQNMQLEGDVDEPHDEPRVHVFLKLFFWSLLQHSSWHPHLLPPLHFHHHLAQPLQPQMQIWLIKDGSITARKSIEGTVCRMSCHCGWENCRLVFQRLTKDRLRRSSSCRAPSHSWNAWRSSPPRRHWQWNRCLFLLRLNNL